MSNQQLSRQDQIKPALVSINKQVQSLYNGDKERANKMIAAALVVGCDPALRNCSPESIGQAVIGIAMMDLSIDKTMGHCYLVPYGNGVQLQVGYKGMIQLLFRAGWAIKSFPVYECDEFDIGEIDYLGNTTSFKFKQAIDERNEGDKDWVYQNLRGVYVVAQHADTKDVYSTFVAKQSIEKLRKVSPNQKNSANPTGIWKDWFSEMAIAKAVKILAKRLPIGDSRAAIALAIDDKTDIGTAVNYEKTADTGMIIDMEATPEPKQKSRSVDSLVGGQKSDSIPVPESVPEQPKNGLVTPPKPTPVPAAPVVDEAPDFGDFTPEPPPYVDDMPTAVVGELMPQSVGTMPIPELKPEPITPNFLNLHQEWRNTIMQWRSKLEFTQGLNDMPKEIKQDAEIKKFMQTRQTFCQQNYPDIW